MAARDEAFEGEEETFTNESQCLVLSADGAGGGVKAVVFPRNVPDVHAKAAELLGLPEGERVRCFHLPMFEKALGWSVHLYIDLQGLEHKLDHNTNATQLWLIANLPNEPPEVQPDSIHGPVLLTAEDFHNEEFVQLGPDEWDKIVKACQQVQPNAQFMPMEPVPVPAEVAA